MKGFWRSLRRAFGAMTLNKDFIVFKFYENQSYSKIKKHLLR